MRKYWRFILPLLLVSVLLVYYNNCGRVMFWDPTSYGGVLGNPMTGYKAFLVGTPAQPFKPIGFGAYVFYSVSPNLPSGLTLDRSTGIISGTPQTATPLSNYTITAKDSYGTPYSMIMGIQTDYGYQVNDLSHDLDSTGPGCVTTVGTCTLRAAIDSPSPFPIIILPPGTTTLTLGTTLTINNATHIYGDFFQGTTIDGNNAIEILNVNSSIGLYNLTLQHGTINGQGGAINISSGVTANIFNCNFLNNSATGAGGNGGAMNVWSPVNVTIVRSTFYNNTASNDGGAYLTSGGSSSDSVTLINDTFDSNTGAWGGALYGGNYNITNSTFTNNINTSCCGATVVSINTVNFTNNLFYHNTGGVAENCSSFAFGGAGFNSFGGNLTDNDGTDCNFGALDFVSTNALLGSTQNNGGYTLTRALLTGSPGIGQGLFSACMTTAGGVDQRGYPRLHSNGTCDIGAYETEP